ncbi:MAG: flagellar hook-associated protein FlgK [Chitinivibrionales bacterium]|nr:flagellar hook-associated protein FlgK [Chitinivibrionales bacterium]
MGLFSTLSVATSGLMASQLGMDVAGQNIANANVDGYSRKKLNQTAAYRADGAFGQMGFGVETINIQRSRDAMIDTQIQRQNEEVGTYTQIDKSLQSIENVFTEPGNTGLQNYIDKFFDSWQNLANNPADVSARTMVQSNANIMVNVFHNMAGELQNLRQTRNDEISARMNRINELSKEIFGLNGEIAAVEVNRQNANDSRDKRDQLVKELSTLTDTNVQENAQGQITITTNGNILVSPVGYEQLETTTTSTTRPDGSSETNVGIRFTDSKRPMDPLSGELRGLFDSRDTIIPKYQAMLDTLANSLVSKVNALHTTGFNLSGFTGIDFFDPNATGASDIKLSASITSNVQNIAAASGGAPVAVGPITSLAGTHNIGVGVALGRRNIVSNSVQVMSAGVMLKENVDYSVDYISGTIQMLNNTNAGNDLSINFSYNTGSFQGPGDNTTAIAIAQLRQALTMSADPIGNATATFSEFYSSLIGQLGLDHNESTSNLTTRKDLVAQYQTQQDSIAGVSLDEEMADIMKFQHTYQAAARIITTTNTMLDALLAIT